MINETSLASNNSNLQSQISRVKIIKIKLQYMYSNFTQQSITEERKIGLITV